MHDRLHSRLFTKKQDPFAILPMELVEMMLQDFNFKDIVYVFSFF